MRANTFFFFMSRNGEIWRNHGEFDDVICRAFGLRYYLVSNNMESTNMIICFYSAFPFDFDCLSESL